MLQLQKWFIDHTHFSPVKRPVAAGLFLFLNSNSSHRHVRFPLFPLGLFLPKLHQLLNDTVISLPRVLN